MRGLHADPWLCAEFLARFEALGEPVQVTKGFRGELTVTAIRR
jgi:hypothetical protein